MKVALVTGGNRGLGRGFVEYLLDQGLLVFAGARNPSDVDKKLSSNQNLKVVKLDVSDDVSIGEVVEFVNKETDHVDYLINNAGINKDSATNNRKEIVCNLGKLDRKALLSMFDVNSVSPAIILQKFLGLLNQDPSFVINVSSCRASFNDEYSNSSGNYGYRASKIALNMMTFCSLHDLPSNVKTFAVHPGDVKTDMNPGGSNLPYDQAKKIMDITKNWKDKFSGRYLRYDGSFYPL